MKNKIPIIINVPHASTNIPRSELKYFTAKDLRHEIEVMTDHYCDDLFDVGCEMINSPVSRLVCDMERFRDDASEVMAAVGMGAVYTKCSDGTKLRRISNAHREELLKRYYDPYHERFEVAVESRLKEYGKCLIIDGHSFYEEPLPYEMDQDPSRPDICIGTDEYHTPKVLCEMIHRFFAEKGYSVSINRPFSGCIVPLKYYKQERRVKSVMVEINRRLYLERGADKSDRYERIKAVIAELVEELLRDLI